MKPIRTNDRRFASIIAVVLMASAVSYSQNRAQMFTALSIEASNCVAHIQSDLAALGNRSYLWLFSRYPALKDIMKARVDGGMFTDRSGFSCLLFYEGDVTLEKWIPKPADMLAQQDPAAGDGYIHTPNPKGIQLHIGISMPLVQNE